MLTTLLEKVSNRLCIKSSLQLSIISILAVTGPLVILTAGIWDDKKDMRIDKSVKVNIKTLDNKNIFKSLRYSI